MESTLYLMCLCFIGCKQVYGGSTYIQNVLSYFNGDWDNTAQANKEGAKHDFMQTRFIPVDVSLFSDPVVFVEEDVNGEVRILQLGVVTDNMDGSFYMKLYNFTDITKYKPREYNITNLSNVTLEDLQSDEDCVASFSFLDDDFLTLIYPNCRYTFNGTHPHFTVSFKCFGYTVSVPINIRQKATIEPYIFRPTSPKYQLINRPKGYVGPCDKQ